ncbi:hypothetical protein SAMN05880566_11311 [Janthinobacterium sp. TND4EL3]|uniref:hypothetical protein n=1 Tax=Janthinobacterium sp. TND4EL3 TaxID=1907311 RepID=UPI00095678BE|nr:hypothetical protein [Janthinobacterium sp. TND4EL3]SIR46668.1 hypothetical protein SAMN05880566_11311 [Janthinobacterium sp. TND4EL3]
MPRKPLLIFLLTLFLTVLQVQWAAPADGYADEALSVLSPEVLGAYPGVLLLFLLAVFARRAMPVMRQAAICTALLAVYWLLANYVTFDARVASWSTYSPLEIWAHVLPSSVISVAACAAAWFGLICFILRQGRAKK